MRKLILEIVHSDFLSKKYIRRQSFVNQVYFLKIILILLIIYALLTVQCSDLQIDKGYICLV